MPGASAHSTDVTAGFPSLTADIKPGSFESVYQVYSELGRGKFAVVKLCRDKTTGREFAAKVQRRRRKGVDCRKDILSEAAMLELTRHHPCFVGLTAVYESSTDITLITDYARGGELCNHLVTEGSISEGETIRLLRQTLIGLKFLHDRCIVHMDIKPQNILLTDPLPGGDVKLCDLGLARYVDSSVSIREIIGTPDYVAPEVLSYEPLQTGCDIWSVGVLAYVMLTGCSPFAGDTKQETFLNISQVNLDFPADLFESISSTATDFIKLLLVQEPSDRLTAGECLQHAWLHEGEQLQTIQLSESEDSGLSTATSLSSSLTLSSTSSSSLSPLSSPSLSSLSAASQFRESVEVSGPQLTDAAAHVKPAAAEMMPVVDANAAEAAEAESEVKAAEVEENYNSERDATNDNSKVDATTDISEIVASINDKSEVCPVVLALQCIDSPYSGKTYSIQHESIKDQQHAHNVNSLCYDGIPEFPFDHSLDSFSFEPNPAAHRECTNFEMLSANFSQELSEAYGAFNKSFRDDSDTLARSCPSTLDKNRPGGQSPPEDGHKPVKRHKLSFACSMPAHPYHCSLDSIDSNQIKKDLASRGDVRDIDSEELKENWFPMNFDDSVLTSSLTRDRTRVKVRRAESWRTNEKSGRGIARVQEVFNRSGSTVRYTSK